MLERAMWITVVMLHLDLLISIYLQAKRTWFHLCAYPWGAGLQAILFDMKYGQVTLLPLPALHLHPYMPFGPGGHSIHPGPYPCMPALWALGRAGITGRGHEDGHRGLGPGGHSIPLCPKGRARTEEMRTILSPVSLPYGLGKGMG